MKNIVLIFTLLLSTLSYSKVNIEEIYNNAKLNNDYSSSMVFTESQLVQEKEIAEWILSNPNRFEDVNQIKIAFENRWFYGSWKKIVRALEFVKRENIQNRLAYFEDLRKRNEAECRRQQERRELLTGLVAVGVTGLGVKIYNNRHEIANFIKENWNNSSSTYSSNESNGNNSKQKNNKVSNSSCEDDLSKDDFFKFKNKVKIGEWKERTIGSGEFSWIELGGGGITDITGRNVSRFKTNSGYTYAGKVGSVEYEFNSIDDYLYAIYVKSECGIITNKVSIKKSN